MDAKVPQRTIFQILRDRICFVEYPPGTVLGEAELAAEFGVSRTPVRAALQKLAHDGLIVSRGGVGTIVTDLSFEEIQDIYHMRLKLAEMIGHMQPHEINEEHVMAAKSLLQRATQLAKTFDITEYGQTNHDLHFLISGIIGNTALQKMWDHFYFQSARMWYPHVRAAPANVAASLVAELVEVIRALGENGVVALGYSQRNSIAYGLSRLAKNSP